MRIGARLRPGFSLPSAGRLRRAAALQSVAPAAAAAADPDAAANRLLAAVCSRPPLAHAGTVPAGYRGLIAATDLEAGAAVLTVPLQNALTVSEFVPQPSAEERAAAATALASWQARHGFTLPAALAQFLLQEGVEWEARLAAWLLWLVRRRRGREQQQAIRDTTTSNTTTGSSGGSSRSSQLDLWDLYVDSLPLPPDMSTFYDYSESEGEEWLALGRWRVSDSWVYGDSGVGLGQL